MKTINIIKKIAEHARKAVLFGALIGGVSVLSYATETTVVPTIEKAQLETINLDAASIEAKILAKTAKKTNAVFAQNKMVLPAAKAKLPKQTFLYGWDGTQYRKIENYNPDNCVEGTEHCLAQSSIDYGPTVPPSEIGNLEMLSDAETQYNFGS